MDVNGSVRVYRGVHEKVDRPDNWPIFSKSFIDIVEAVWMCGTVLIEEIIHLCTTGCKQKIVRSHIIRHDSEHRAIQIGVQNISDMKFQRSVAVHRDSRGEKFLLFKCGFRKEIRDLSSLRIGYGNGLPLFSNETLFRCMRE